MSCAAKIVPLFAHFTQLNPLYPPSVIRPLPKVPARLSRFLFWPSSHPGFFFHTTPSPLSSLPSRVSPLSNTTVSSRFNRFPQLTAPLLVPGLRLPGNAQSPHPSTATLHPRYYPPLRPGGSAQPAGDATELADSVMNGFSCN